MLSSDGEPRCVALRGHGARPTELSRPLPGRRGSPSPAARTPHGAPSPARPAESPATAPLSHTRSGRRGRGGVTLRGDRRGRDERGLSPGVRLDRRCDRVSRLSVRRVAEAGADTESPQRHRAGSLAREGTRTARCGADRGGPAPLELPEGRLTPGKPTGPPPQQGEAGPRFVRGQASTALTTSEITSARLRA